jgi:hypothetical protein
LKRKRLHLAKSQQYATFVMQENRKKIHKKGGA